MFIQHQNLLLLCSHLVMLLISIPFYIYYILHLLHMYVGTKVLKTFLIFCTWLSDYNMCVHIQNTYICIMNII